MSDFGVLQQARTPRGRREADARRRRRARRVRLAGAGMTATALVLLALMVAGLSDRHRGSGSLARHPASIPVHRTAPPNPYGYALSSIQVVPKFKTGLRSGLLFDVRSGQVLWERNAGRRLPIASLTKMMTGLVVVANARPAARVLITPQALQFSGSGVGLLPLGRRVPLRALLYGLLLPSGNDAAIALAQHVAGTQARFISLMNSAARAMGLGCTRFSTVSGILDQGNLSCARDLARIAQAVLADRTLSAIVATASAVLPFPIKGGKLYLSNNNPLLRMGFPGADGVKTGYTVAAGQCLVASARHGRSWLGVVLLHSADPPGQAVSLLRMGFTATNRNQLTGTRSIP